jgi:gas vesicle protein
MFRHESGSSTLVSFLLGGLTGASLAVLLAPQSGKETRGQIRTRGREVARSSRLLGAQVKERSRSIASSLRRNTASPEMPPVAASAVPEPAVTPPPDRMA